MQPPRRRATELEAVLNAAGRAGYFDDVLFKGRKEQARRAAWRR